MPPKRKAAASTKRTITPPARRQKTAAAVEPAVEETTTVEVYGFDKEWLQPLYEMYGKRELTDVVLSVGDIFRDVHRVVVATVSPVLGKMFSTGMVESSSKQVELQDVSELALPGRPSSPWSRWGRQKRLSGWRGRTSMCRT